jgi:putative effector of murein hydrolase LrgA (UPF0299 family)
MANTYNYFKNAYLKISELIQNNSIFVFLIALILIVIPLKHIFGSIATIVFVLVSLATFKKANFYISKEYLLPILLYLLMVLSLLWTRDFKLSVNGLQKELPFLFIPIAFIIIPKLTKAFVYKIIGIYSYSMVFYALYYFGNAIFRYLTSKDSSVFFYHELVTLDLNAIYVSVFVSFAMFYFINKNGKLFIEKVALTVLVLLIFLLSSKSIITIDFILIICYYSFFSDISTTVKTTTIIAVSLFLISSLFFVKKVQERFLLEYETAFVDNTVNSTVGNENAKVYNVSLKQAWCEEKFQANHFFPGTALRIYQLRAFKEMIAEDAIFFTGFGLEAAQDKIRERANKHALYPGYGDFNFHNQYIQTFSELGFFGFLIVVLMLAFNVKNAWRSKDFLHIAFAITMIMLFLTESFFCRQRGVIFFITIYCMFNSIHAVKKIKNE